MEDPNTTHHSYAVQNIIGMVPNLLIRWGLTLIFFVFLIFLIISWLIKYPETLEAPVKLTTSEIPIPIVARSNGNLVSLHVKDNQIVMKGDYLGFIESPANISDILILDSLLHRIRQITNDDFREIQNFDLSNNFDLGSIQYAFASFYQAFKNVNFFFGNSYYVKKVENLQNQLKNEKGIYRALLKQKDIYKNNLEIAQKIYSKKQQLFEKTFISEDELLNERSQLFKSELAYENIEISLAKNINNQYNYENGILDLKKMQEEQKINFRVQLNNLLYEISNWKLRYALVAPAKGKISMPNLINVNQFVNANDVVMYVLPGMANYIGQIHINQFNLGKIQTGQMVRVEFLSYPGQEYGVVEAQVLSISAVPNEDNYLVKIAFPHGLVTNYGKELKFRHGMIGNADIITEELRLIDRLFYKFKSIYSSKM